MEKSEQVEILTNVELNEKNESQKCIIEVEKTFNVIEPAISGDDDKPSTNDEKQEILNITEVIAQDNIQNSRENTFNDSHVNEKIQEEREEPLQDVTMMSIDEPIEKEVIPQNEEITNVTTTIPQESPLKTESFDFARPEQIPQPKIPVIITPSNEVFTSASSCKFHLKNVSYKESFFNSLRQFLKI